MHAATVIPYFFILVMREGGNKTLVKEQHRSNKSLMWGCFRPPLPPRSGCGSYIQWLAHSFSIAGHGILHESDCVERAGGNTTDHPAIRS
jgi:hypothetical protein